MKIGAEDRSKLILAGSFGVLALAYLVYTLAGTWGSSDAAPAPAVANSRTAVTNTVNSAATGRPISSHLDPALHPEGMLLTESLVYAGSGRNIFLAPGTQVDVAAATKIPTPIATARYVPPVGRTGPPPPPPIDLRFFGTATRRDGKRQAFLLRGEDVFVASPGDIVSRRYRVDTITQTSVEVTDLTNNNTQRLTMSPQ